MPATTAPRIVNPQLFTVREVCGLLRACPTTVRSLIRRGELSAVNVGADLRIPLDGLLFYLNAHLVPSRSHPPIQSWRRRDGAG
ncbi:MAG: helix-turn-helix domain-containing protein [Candidatus Dormibacteraeota bacterium]|nr:helix-turn-helix domain-containing protein [Candidatus Dormibacteraeota bacterium]